MEVRDLVQEAVIKTFPKKKQCEKVKWLFEEGLQIAGRDWGQEEKGTTEDEMTGWHH